MPCAETHIVSNEWLNKDFAVFNYGADDEFVAFTIESFLPEEVLDEWLDGAVFELAIFLDDRFELGAPLRKSVMKEFEIWEQDAPSLVEKWVRF